MAKKFYAIGSRSLCYKTIYSHNGKHLQPSLMFAGKPFLFLKKIKRASLLRATVRLDFHKTTKSVVVELAPRHQHNDTQHNDIPHNDSQHKDIQYNGRVL